MPEVPERCTMAMPDALRPNYVSAESESPTILRVSGATGLFSVVASVTAEAGGVRLSSHGDPHMPGATVEGHDLAEAIGHLLLILASRNLTLCACGNCAFFRFSHMSYQMSAGGRGYCTIKGIDKTSAERDVVFLLDHCEAFSPRASNRSWWDEED